MNKNINYSMWFYIITCLILLLIMYCIYFNYAKERKIFIQEAVNNFEKNTSLTISNFSLMHSKTNLNLENNNIKEELDEAIKPHFDLLKSSLKDGSDFGINSVSFWLSFLSLIMIIFTILGIFANNNILETNRRQSELSIKEFKLKFENLKNNLLKENKEFINKVKCDIEKEIYDSVNSVKNTKNEADILKSEILNIKMEAENILNKIKEQTKQSEENANKAKVSELFTKALNEEDKKKYDEAIKYYTELLKLDKNNLDALNNRGVIYDGKYTNTQNEKYFNLALADYNEVLNRENDNNNFNTLNNRGWLYLVNYSISKNIESLNNAEKDIEKALTINDTNLNLLSNNGIVLLFKYRIEKDIKLLNKSKEYLYKAINYKREKHDLGETYYYLSLVYKEYSQLESIEDTQKEEYKNKSEEVLKKSKELGYKSFIED